MRTPQLDFPEDNKEGLMGTKEQHNDSHIKIVEGLDVGTRILGWVICAGIWALYFKSQWNLPKIEEINGTMASYSLLAGIGPVAFFKLKEVIGSYKSKMDAFKEMIKVKK